MMHHWTQKRKVSLAIHTTVVLIPFGFSTVSAAFFWQGLFNSWLIAAPMVLVIDVLALLGLVLFIAKIASPFVVLRHALPFISIVPLGLELFGLLQHNGPLLAVPVTFIVTAILVAIAWQCFTTIEALFIDPIEAAREKARSQVGALGVTLAQLDVMNHVIDGFARERLAYHAPLTMARPADSPAPALVNTETSKALPTAAYECPNCGTHLTIGQYGAARRYGKCAACKEA
jgi:hypothetical protein